MFEGFSGRDALGRIDRQHLIDQIFGLRRYRIPFRRRILSQKLMELQLKKKETKQLVQRRRVNSRRKLRL